MGLDDRKLQQVERVLLAPEGALDNPTVQGELNALEEVVLTR